MKNQRSLANPKNYLSIFYSTFSLQMDHFCSINDVVFSSHRVSNDCIFEIQKNPIFLLTFVAFICIIHFVDCESNWQERAGVAELADAQASGACGR